MPSSFYTRERTTLEPGIVSAQVHTGPIARPAINGGLDLVNPGRVKFQRVNYTLTHASVSFSPAFPGDPAVDLLMLRLVLAYDTAKLEFEGFEVDGVDADGNPETEFLTEDVPAFLSMSCEGEGFQRICRGGLPHFAQLRGIRGVEDVLPEDVIIVDMASALRLLVVTTAEIVAATSNRNSDRDKYLMSVTEDVVEELVGDIP